MLKQNYVLLPHILETLSEKAQFCDTYDNLCNELKCVLSANNLQSLEIENCIKSALSAGKNLGILSMTNDLVRLPFNYKNTTKKPKKDMRRAALLTQPRRTHENMPAIRELGQRRRIIGARRSRNRTSRRSRGRMLRRRSQSKHC